MATDIGALLSRHFPELVRLATKYVDEHEAEDVVQEVYKNVLTKTNDFDDIKNPSRWLRIVVHNTAISFGKKKTLRHIKHALHDNIPDVGKQLLYSDGKSKISDAIAKLPAWLSCVFKMFAVDGMEYDAIAQALNISNGAARTAVCRARRILREELRELR